MKYIPGYLLLLVLVCFSADVSAQVPVREEPHHVPVLENEYIRLLDVHLNAGDTTQYHIHATPSVIVMLSNSVIGMQKLNEAPSVPGSVTAGQTSFIDYGSNPVTHRVYNSGNNVFHVMDIELLKNKPSQDSCNALQPNIAETISNENLVRVYKLTAGSMQTLNIPAGNCTHLLICISGIVTAADKKLSNGDYVFFNPDTSIAVRNQQNENATCILLEIK